MSDVKSSLSSSDSPSFLRVQLNNIDSYQCPPTVLDRKRPKSGATSFPHVPVVRVFGVTDSGHKALLHIHGVFPYLFVKYEEVLDKVDQVISQLRVQINTAMCNAYRRPADDARNQFVADIVLCKGVPFYGYHQQMEPYLKIYMLSPSYMTKFADLLRTGVITGRPLQPYESHIPHSLQFFTDFNLFGCNWVRLSNAYFRDPIPPSFEQENVKILSDRSFPRMSVCELEIDITADMILNRYELSKQDGPKGSMGLKLTSLSELWTEDTQRRHTLGAESFDSQQKARSSASRPETRHWAREDEFAARLDELIDSKLYDRSDQLDTSLDGIPTCLEAVDAMVLPDTAKQTEAAPPVTTEILANITESDLISSDEEQTDSDEEANLPSFGTLKRKRSSESIIRDSFAAPVASRVQSIQFSSQSLRDLHGFSPSRPRLSMEFVPSQKSDIALISDEFNLSSDSTLLMSACKPPSANSVLDEIESYGLPRILYQEPFYSKDKDVPLIAATYAGIEYRLQGNSAKYLKPFEFSDDFPKLPTSASNNAPTLVEYSIPPPRRHSVEKWLSRPPKPVKTPDFASQIAPPNPRNMFKYASQKVSSNNRAITDLSYMSVLVIEVHANGNAGKLPNPATDPVQAVFWRLLQDKTMTEDDPRGIICFGDEQFEKKLRSATDHQVVCERSEYDLYGSLIQLVRFYDPDILAGFEVQNASWGYAIDRFNAAYDDDFSILLGRLSPRPNGGGTILRGSKWGLRHTNDLTVPGRYVINIWRILRSELNLLQYTLENVVFQTLHKRIPHYANEDLTKWYTGICTNDLATLLAYYSERVDFMVRIVENQEIVSRFSEQARIIGIDYNSVFYRGSQYKVESLLARLAKKENYVMISPSTKQVGQQNALEYIPLVMEPESLFYTSPVLVLDFQSLYPSIMLAYNYCYSTCMGRVIPWRGRNKIGVVDDLKLDPGVLEKLKDKIKVAPNGVMYLRSDERYSLLARMLKELLDTRVMLKDSMSKFYKDDVRFQKSMNNRQLALKLTANVTYGYTSATFSGRMPCAEIADSIVLSARETLESAIDTINATEKWGARVVYGDTDSIFVHLPGKSREQAFEIGNDIASTITSMNPQPVKLKFEKVYHPCVLQTKKRYVGYMYETPEQVDPVFDAKGTETIRRDGTPAQQKIEEQALRILFETSDLSKVKEYIQAEWTKIMTENVSIQDFCFAKEVKLGTYKEGSSVPPGAVIAARRSARDERAEPQYRERVPYVVISGAPDSRLVDRCVEPEYLLLNPHVHLDAEYYIIKHLIPPLERIFSLFGANVRSWYDEMPRSMKFRYFEAVGNGSTSLNNYLRPSSCAICGAKITNDGDNGLCKRCSARPDQSRYIMIMRVKRQQQKVMQLETICRQCSRIQPASDICCVSGDCPIYYSRHKANNDLRALMSIDYVTNSW
uniref:DNA polymerase n=1 Tax=Blastobotrys adeninivorans TaxID=409370 RepID=A0A060T9Z7_BLAAD